MHRNSSSIDRVVRRLQRACTTRTGLGDYSMSDDTELQVILQFGLFFPGLVLFTEFINLGSVRPLDSRARLCLRLAPECPPFVLTAPC